MVSVDAEISLSSDVCHHVLGHVLGEVVSVLMLKEKETKTMYSILQSQETELATRTAFTTCPCNWNQGLKQCLQTHNVIHAVPPGRAVHVLIAVDLVRDRPKQAAAVLVHILDDKPLLTHRALKPQVFFLPLFLGEGEAEMRVLVLGVVPALVDLAAATPSLTAPSRTRAADGRLGRIVLYRVIFFLRCLGLGLRDDCGDCIYGIVPVVALVPLAAGNPGDVASDDSVRAVVSAFGGVAR
jgi:hypothetical protein